MYLYPKTTKRKLQPDQRSSTVGTEERNDRSSPSLPQSKPSGGVIFFADTIKRTHTERKKKRHKKGHDRRIMYRRGKKEKHATYRLSKHMEQENVELGTLEATGTFARVGV